MFSVIKEKGHMISKLFVYQIAISLLGLFVVSPFNGYIQVAAAVFSTLFYFSLVCYAVIEDGQKDYVSCSAGRIEGKWYSGFVYALTSYIPTILIVAVQTVLHLVTDVSALTAIKAILGFIIRFFLMGMYLGFDTGLVHRGYDSVNQVKAVIKGSDVLVFMSDNYLIFAVCLVFLPVVAGISYYLSFKGKIHVNTAPKSKK